MKTSQRGASDGVSILCAGTDPKSSALHAGTGRSLARDSHVPEAPLSAVFAQRIFGFFPEPAFKLADTLQVEEVVHDFGLSPMLAAHKMYSTEKAIQAHLIPKRLLGVTP